MGWQGKMWRLAGTSSIVLFVASLPAIPEAMGQDFPTVRNRDYTLDLYQGHAIGSARIVGMGGVSAATAQGSSGMLINPASAGVRPTTSNDTWDWDWHLDTQSPSVGNDSDNNGIEDNTEDEKLDYDPNATFGLVLQYKDWGVGVTGLVQTVETTAIDEVGDEAIIDTQGSIFKLSLAHYLFDGQLVVGGGLRIASLEIRSTSIDAVTSEKGTPQQLLTLSGSSIESGALWKPNGKSIRVGGSISFPKVVEDTVEDRDPLDYAGYIVPRKLKVPWSATIGVAGRRAKTPWNIRYKKSEWRDEKALLWGVDVSLTGPTRRGSGLEAFAQHQLQPSGRKHALSIRGGVEYEWLPGTLRVRGGSYFEPSRFKDVDGDDIPGRVHLTLGLEWHFWSFSIWDYNYRAKVSAFADAADRFAVSGLSFGFWH